MSSEASPRTSSSGSSNSGSSSSRNHLPSLEELDKSMFGDVNVRLADALTESCAAALRSGVESLPLLQRRQELLEQLGKPYLKHLDIMEAYAGRRIFTVKYAGAGPHRRHHIVQRFLGMEEPGEDVSPTTNRRSSSSATTSRDLPPTTTLSTTTLYPSSPDDIPTKEERMNLDVELQSLATQLKEATLRRTVLRKQCADLHATHQWTSSVTDTIQSSSICGGGTTSDDDEDNVHETISAAVVGGQGLQDMIREGTKLQMELEERKKEAAMMEEDKDDGDGTAGGDPMTFPELRSIKRRGSVVLTSEELYRHERQTVKVSRKGVDALLVSTSSSSSSSSKENVVN
jgi:hypothetical protein